MGDFFKFLAILILGLFLLGTIGGGCMENYYHSKGVSDACMASRDPILCQAIKDSSKLK